MRIYWVFDSSSLSFNYFRLSFAGENFVRSTGQVKEITNLQLFSWEAGQRGSNVHLQVKAGSDFPKMYNFLTCKTEEVIKILVRYCFLFTKKVDKTLVW